jgi:hypothetical protein
MSRKSMEYPCPRCGQPKAPESAHCQHCWYKTRYVNPEQDCACGCGGKTSSPYNRFVFGHQNVWKTFPEHRYVVDVDTGCWNWTGHLVKGGYGRTNRGGRAQMAHRIAYEMIREPIPAGMCIDHAVCGNRRCVNPDHMEVVTRGENTRRSNLRRRHQESLQ